MDFLIADTFTDSLARLTGDEQKAVKTTAFDLQLNPASPGMSFHKLDKARDKKFWSVRVSGGLRLIVHKTDASLLVCYVDHHDGAYRWAERRKLETHPKTGAAQLIEIRETFQEIVVPVVVHEQKPARPERKPFAEVPDDRLLDYGVPPEWLEDVRKATEDTLLALAEHLPSEAAEALLELATGGKPREATPTRTAVSPFLHPDAQRRFRVIENAEELARALEYPWEKWTIFLHPAQRHLVEADYSGPVRVAGSAGTGKTIVALHRAVYLARRHREARVLLTTFSDILANALRGRLARLIGNEPRIAERLEVHSINAIGERLYKYQFGQPQFVDQNTMSRFMTEASAEVSGHRFSLPLLLSEWEHVVDPWQLDTWEAYRDVRRLGRKKRLPDQQRAILWAIIERVRERLASMGLITYAGLFSKLAAVVTGREHRPFDFVVVDEAQDIGIAHLRFLAALGADRPNGLFFAGDLGQRIFQQPFSWKASGVDVRGRSQTLNVNYRTSHQIRVQADRLLEAELPDADGNVEKRSVTISTFNGSPPTVQICGSREEEIGRVGEWISARRNEGVLPNEIGVFVRSAAELERARSAVKSAGLHFNVLDNNAATTGGQLSISTMHLAKGLEFRAVVVMACDDEVIPLQERIETVADDTDLEEAYITERQLLYVACTRARDELLVSGVAPASEFLDDLGARKN